jgi:tyrosyl-tRNA synthetase
LFGGSLEGLTEVQLGEIFADVPSSEMSAAAVRGMSVVDALVATKLVPSKGEARRLIASGGAYLNNERVSDPAAAVGSVLKPEARLVVFRSGKKNYHLVKLGA